MKNTDILFVTALLMCGFSMLCFAGLSIIQMRKKEGNPVEAKGGAGDAGPEGSDPLSGILDALSKVTTAFGTAGPISTAATLAVFFMIVALIASGMISIGAAPAAGT